MIPALNLLSIVTLTLIFGILLVRIFQTPKSGILTFSLAMALLLLTTMTNVLEHLDIAPELDDWEDTLEVLFLPTLILSLHIGILQRQLDARIISEKKFNAIYNNAYTFIGLLDKEGNLLDTNEAARKFARLQPNEGLGQPFQEGPWWAHSSEEKRKITKAIKAASEGIGSHFETTHQGPNGQRINVDFSLTPVFNEQNEVIYLIPEGRDVTTLVEIQQELETHKNQLEHLVAEKTKELNAALRVSKQLNQKLYDSNQQMELSNDELNKKSDRLRLALDQLKNAQNHLIESEKMASLGVLTAGVAHEINNPLNYIMGGVSGLHQYVKLNAKDGLSELESSLSTIYSGIDRISGIVKSLSSYSQSDYNNLMACSIFQTIEDCMILLHSKHDRRIDFQLALDEDVKVLANAGRLHQLFLNLLNNSIQAIKEEGTIKISSSKKGKHVLISIEDSGMGIYKKDMKKIFDPFFTTKDPNEGIGLGLSISQRIIKDYKGSIKYTSEPDHGTVVEVRFPAIS